MADDTVALQIKPLQVDAATPLLAASQLKTAGALQQLYGAQANQMGLQGQLLGARLKSAQNVASQLAGGAGGDAPAGGAPAAAPGADGGGPAAGGGSTQGAGLQNALAVHAMYDPEGAKAVESVLGSELDRAQKKVAFTRDALGRAAAAVYQFPPGSPQEKQANDQQADDLYNQGVIPAAMRDQIKAQVPDRLTLLRHIVDAQTSKEWMETSGQQAGNVAQAQLPSELTKIGATGAQARQTQAAAYPQKLGEIAATGAQTRQTAAEAPREIAPGGMTYYPPGGVPVAPVAPAPGAAPGAAAAPSPAAPGATPSAQPGAQMTPAGQTVGAAQPAVTPTPGGGKILANPNSPALINLNQGNVPKYLEQMGGAAADYIIDKQKDIPGVQAALFNIEDLRGALRGLPTGPGTETQNTVQNFASRMGIDFNKILPNGWQADPTKASIAQKNITQLSAAWAKANFPTRITNVDMNIAMGAVPNFGNDEKANEHVMDNLEQLQRMKLEEAKYFRDYAKGLPKGTAPDMGEMIDGWTQHIVDMKGITPQLKRSYLSYADLAANPQVGGSSAPAPLPGGAVRSAAGPGGHTIFQYKGPQGYFWGDERGQPVQ